MAVELHSHIVPQEPISLINLHSNSNNGIYLHEDEDEDEEDKKHHPSIIITTTHSDNISPSSDDFVDGKERFSLSDSDIIQETDSFFSISPSSDEDHHGQDIQTHYDSHNNIIQPNSFLPKPKPPPSLSTSPNHPQNNNNNMPSFRKYIRDTSNTLSAAIIKTISSLQDQNQDHHVTQINLSGLKVVVNHKTTPHQHLKGRISFFSKSNCRDCKAVRTLFNEKGFKFVEINIDVYPHRRKELFHRTGTSSVPQIFFNDNLFGGLVALNSLRNSGQFENRIREMLSTKCSKDAPAPPLYGFDDPESESESESESKSESKSKSKSEWTVEMVRYLRQRLPIQDRLIKMKIVKNCFSGSEMVESLIQRLDCGRRKAVEVGKQMAQQLFIHHVFGENDFEDGNHYYRFLEHGPFIPRCFNFRGSINDNDPKPAAMVGLRLAKIMSAILESYASEDLLLVDYQSISNSEEFRRYINLIQELHRVNLLELSPNEKLAFFLNMYNAMVIHALIRFGRPEGVIDRKSFFSDFQYLVGGQPYSLITIKNGILRGNRRPPYSLVKPFSNGDKRLEVAFDKVNPLIHFGLCNGTKSSPRVRFYTPQGVEAELRSAAREFFQSGGVEVDLDKRTVYLTGIIKWFSVDFGQEKEIVKWIMSYLDANKAGLLTHLLGDGGPLNIAYQNYNWTMNS